MKFEKWISCLLGVLLAFGLSAAGTFCLITGFVFPTVNTAAVLLWCGLCSCVFSLVYTLKLPWVNWGLTALAALCFWWYGDLTDSVQGLLHHLSRIYSMGYGWPVFVGTLDMPLYQDVTTAVCIFATLSSLFTSRAVCAGKGAVPAVVFSVMPLLCCLVVTDRVPDTVCLFVLLLALSVLILTQTLRRRSQAQANRLVALVLIPALILVGVLFLAYPRQQYQNQDFGKQLVEDVKDWFAYLAELMESGGPVRADGGAVDLKNVGKRTDSTSRIMTVTAQASGPLYLRSCAYDTYYDNNWTNLAVECKNLYWPDQRFLRDTGIVTVDTVSVLDMIVFPYYPDESTLDEISRGISNYGRKREYSFTWQQLSGLYSASEDLTYRLPDTLTQLPGSTYYWTQKLLPDILRNANTVYSKAQAIGDFVSKSAKYDLNTGKMPSDASDFAQWFIEESDTGYCVHFATAATVLLRGAGIPARYVTGYLVNVTAGEITTVYGKNAHAWVEYWLPGVGWVMLEPTPSASLQEQITQQERVDSTEAPPQETREPHSMEDPEPAVQHSDLWIAWLVLAVLVGLVLTIAQWRLRVFLRKKKRYEGTVNQRSLAVWVQLAQLMRLLGETPDPTLYEMAEKAKFSQHELSRADLAILTGRLNKATDQLRQKPLYQKIYYTLILAIY